MKKRKYIFVILSAIIFLLIIILLAIDFVTFNERDLKQIHYNGTSISIIDDYVFFKERLIGYVTLAENIETGGTKFLSLGSSTPNFLYNNEFYFSSNLTFKAASYIYSRKLNEPFVYMLTNDSIGKCVNIDNYLYYQKASTVGDDDYSESGFIFKTNLDTRETEPVLTCNTWQYYIQDNNIYYTTPVYDSYDKYKDIVSDAVYCYSLESKTTKAIADGLIDTFVIENDNVVYSKYVYNGSDSKKYELWLLKINTGETLKLCDSVDSFKLSNGTVLYVEKCSNNVLNIYDCYDGNIIMISADDTIDTYKIHEDNLYYVDSSDTSVLNIYNLSNRDSKSIRLKGFDKDKDFVLYKDTIYYYKQNGKFSKYSMITRNY